MNAPSPHREAGQRWHDEDRPRPKKKHRTRQPNRALLWGLIGGGAGLMVVVLIVIIVLVAGGGLAARDPKFDQIKKGMSEEEVLELLGKTAWSYDAKAAGVWTSPRMTLEEFHKNPARSEEIQDVIFIYFRDGKVDNVYRKTGAEFRQPRPR